MRMKVEKVSGTACCRGDASAVDAIVAICRAFLSERMVAHGCAPAGPNSTMILEVTDICGRCQTE